MRIGLISYDFFPFQGGQGRNFHEVFTRLKSLDPGLELAALSPCQNELPGHIRILPFVHRLPGAQLWFSFFLNLFWKRILRKHRLAAVLLNGGPGGILLLRRCPVPMLYYVNHTYWQQAHLVPGQFWKRIFVPLERRGYHAALSLFADSRATTQALVSHYGIQPDRVNLVPVGIDPEKFKPLELNKLPHSLLYLGRLEPRKGLEFLLNVLPLIRAHIPDVILYVGGSGSLRPMLEASVRRLGLSSHVRFLGYVPEADLARWYNQCQVQVIPSIFEGLGITAIEGMACGTPAVATSGSGLSDIVQDGVSGTLAAFGDREAFAQAVLDLLSHPDRYRLFRENGIRRVKEVFVWDVIMEQYRRQLRRLLAPGSEPPEGS